MSKEKELKITKEKILAMAKECPEARSVLKRGFPEAFKVPTPKKKWKNITKKVNVFLHLHTGSGGYDIHFTMEKTCENWFAWMWADGRIEVDDSRYKIKKTKGTGSYETSEPKLKIYKMS